MWAEAIREIRSRVARYRDRRRFEAEMDDELRFHVEMQTEQHVRNGLSPDEARRRALVEFGGLEQARENCRDNVGIRLMTDFFQDLRYALRTLFRSPGFTIVAVLTLALGIGANTAVFSVVNTLLLKPLPFENPERIVMLWQQNPETGFDQEQVAWGDLPDWQNGNTTFEQFGYVINQTTASRNFMLRTGEEDYTRIRARYVSSGLFDVLGVAPLHGQTLDETDDQPGGPPRAVLSHALWTQAFDSFPDIIGQPINLGRGENFEVVGIMPPGFRFPEDADCWMSVSAWAAPQRLTRLMQRRDAHGLWVVGRLREGVTVEEADSDLNRIQQQIAADPANQNMVRLASEVITTRLLDQVNGQRTRPALLLLMGAVGFVLLIACANVANLLLARAMSRRREIAIRVSLGAGRLRVIRQLLTESLLLSLLGAGAGILVAFWGIDLLELIHTDAAYLGVKEFRFDRLANVSIDLQVLGFTVAVSVATGILFGLIPAIQASRLNVNEALKEDSRAGTPGRAARAVRNSLLVSEVALALVLLAGAGVAVQGFAKMLDIDTGLEPDQVLRAEIDLAMSQQVYGMGNAEAYEEVKKRVLAVPGVESIAGTGEPPLVRSGWNDIFKVVGSDHEAFTQAELPATDVRVMGPGVFKTLGIPILEGREFTDDDDRSVPNVTVINDVLKERFFPDESPLGETIQMRGWRGHEKIVIGVVGSTRNYSKDSEDRPEIYFPFKQSFLAGAEVGPMMMIKVQGDVNEIIPAIRDAVNGKDPRQQVLIKFAGMKEVLDMSASSERFQTVLLGCFAGVALLLAVVGVFGVMSYSTSQRVQEIGIRMALGAQPGQILRAITWQGVSLCLIGIAIGAVVALSLSRMLSHLFFGLESIDPLTLAGVSLTLLLVGPLACLIPAWRAMRVDPVVALRQE